LWVYQPETAGRTYKELDELFAMKVPGRKFKSTKTQIETEGDQAKDLKQEQCFTTMLRGPYQLCSRRSALCYATSLHRLVPLCHDSCDRN